MVTQHELLVFPSRTLVQADRTRRAQRSPHGVAFGTCALSVQEFEQLLIDGVLGAQARILTDLEERCRLRVLVGNEPLRKLYDERVIETPGFIPALQSTLHALEDADDGANRSVSSPEPLLGSWHQDLKQAGLWSRHTALREVMARVERGAKLPVPLLQCSRLVFKHSFDLSALQIALIEALSKRLAGLAEVAIEIPYHESTSDYFRHPARVLAQFEKTGDRLQTTVLPTDDHNHPGVGVELLRCLLQQGSSSEVPWSRISLHQSTSPTTERLTIVEQVHAWLADGIAPDQIAIAMRHLDQEAHEIRLLLQDSGVQTKAIPQAALSAAPMLRWLSTLLSLSYRPWNPSILAEVLSSSYARDLHELDAGAVARGLAWLLPYAHTNREKLIETLERNVSQDAQVCARALQILAKHLEAFSTPGLLASFVQSTRQLMSDCRLHRNLPLPARTAEDLRTLIAAEDTMSAELGIAMGREDLGLTALEQVLSHLELIGTRLQSAVSPKQYWHILNDGLRSQNVYPPGQQSGAIRLVSVRDLIGMQVEAVMIPHLVDGRFPASKRKECVMPGPEQSHHEKEALLFALGMSAATCRLALSYSVYDTAGREAMPAWFMQECLLAARSTGAPDVIRTHSEEPIPQPGRAFGAERQARAMVHAFAAAGPGQTPAELATTEVPIVATMAFETASALHRVVIERQRLAHAYAKGSLFNTPYTGSIPGDLIAIPGSEVKPLSASQLETAARCPFQDFVGRVLRLGATPLPRMDIDPRDDGQLAHACFEAAMLAIIAHSPGPYRPDNAQGACTTALQAINQRLEQERQRQLLPSGLFDYRANHLRRRLLLLIESLYKQDEPFEPAGVEVAFGPKGTWPALAVSHPELEQPIWIQGRIDLLEKDGDTLRAADLKRKGTNGLREALKTDVLGHTSLQLPIYAAACATQSPTEACDARFLSLKDSKAMLSLRHHVLSSSWKDQRSANDILTLTHPDGTPTPLGDGICRLATVMRSNNYALNPASGACLRCDYAALCRVPRLDLPDVN